MTVHEALAVMLNDTKSHNTTLNWAVNYCQRAMNMEEGSEALRVQCIYILGNISSWRHEQAKNVRAVLKAASKR